MEKLLSTQPDDILFSFLALANPKYKNLGQTSRDLAVKMFKQTKFKIVPNLDLQRGQLSVDIHVKPLPRPDWEKMPFDCVMLVTRFLLGNKSEQKFHGFGTSCSQIKGDEDSYRCLHIGTNATEHTVPQTDIRMYPQLNAFFGNKVNWNQIQLILARQFELKQNNQLLCSKYFFDKRLRGIEEAKESVGIPFQIAVNLHLTKVLTRTKFLESYKYDCNGMHPALLYDPTFTNNQNPHSVLPRIFRNRVYLVQNPVHELVFKKWDQKIARRDLLKFEKTDVNIRCVERTKANSVPAPTCFAMADVACSVYSEYYFTGRMKYKRGWIYELVKFNNMNETVPYYWQDELSEFKDVTESTLIKSNEYTNYRQLWYGRSDAEIEDTFTRKDRLRCKRFKEWTMFTKILEDIFDFDSKPLGANPRPCKISWDAVRWLNEECRNKY